jgi:hypothetical protein
MHVHRQRLDLLFEAAVLFLGAYHEIEPPGASRQQILENVRFAIGQRDDMRVLGHCAAVVPIATSARIHLKLSLAAMVCRCRISPKLLARTLRFDRAIRLIGGGRVAGLADLAAASGYADQAHLSREFRVFAGSAPAAFLRRRLPDDGGFLV